MYWNSNSESVILNLQSVKSNQLFCPSMNSPSAGQILPSELKFLIATFCRPSTLASLARVHSSYQEEAECVLYRAHTLSLDLDRGKCLDALSTNPRKASLVKSLTVESPYFGLSRLAECKVQVRTMIASLSNALYHMRGLTDLRIRLPSEVYWLNYDDIVEQITDMLRSVFIKLLYVLTQILTNLTGTCRSEHLQLHTLYISHSNSFDIARIINYQPKLRLLGLYSWDTAEKTLNSLKCIGIDSPDSASTLPLVFWLELPKLDLLSIFPAFYPTHSSIFQPIAVSLDQGSGQTVQASTGRESVHHVCIYVRDFSDMAYIRSVVEDMVLSFSGVVLLHLSVERPSQIVSLIRAFCAWNSTD